MIGFSLGAHIVGAAGDHFQKLTGAKFGRITGLDPANPCFKTGHSLHGIHKSVADFVDIIHTNPGALGKREALGHVDFYPDGYASVKSGCTFLSCSHLRAWQYYAESVYREHERDFMASPCSSLLMLELGLCSGGEIPMGFATPKDARGSYLLGVYEESPYGKNHKTREFDKNCAKC